MTQPAPIAIPSKKPRLISVMTHGAAWNASVSGLLQGDSKGTFVQTVEEWVLNGPVPNSDNLLLITNMSLNPDGSVEVFARPVDGHPLVSQNIGIVIQLAAGLVKIVTSFAQMPLWEAMQREQTDRTVAMLVARWLNLPEDLVQEHFDDMRDEIAGLEPDDSNGEPETPPNGAGTAESGAPS